MKISKRLGGVKTSECLKSIDSGDLRKAVEITLEYYDKSYLHGLKRRSGMNIRYFTPESENVEENATCVLELCYELMKP